MALVRGRGDVVTVLDGRDDAVFKPRVWPGLEAGSGVGIVLAVIAAKMEALMVNEAIIFILKVSLVWQRLRRRIEQCVGDARRPRR